MDSDDKELMDAEGLVFKRTIAKTTHGMVFQVEWMKYKKIFALKRIERSYFDKSQITLIKNLYHPNIINIYKVLAGKKYIYLIMDYCPVDLHHFIEEIGSISENNFIQHAYFMLQSIKTIHNQKICHKRINPSKFLFDKYGRVLLSNFSSSKQYNAGKNDELEFSRAKAIDIWCIGETFYYMVTGIHITQLYDSQEIAMTKDYSLIKYPRGLSKDCIALISSCLNCIVKSCPSIEDLLRNPIFANISTSYFDLSKKHSFSLNKSHGSLNFTVKPVLTKKLIPII